MHLFDNNTQFCVKCGVSLQAIIKSDNKILCDEVGNVVGVSHILEQRKRDRLIRSKLTESSNVESDPCKA